MPLLLAPNAFQFGTVADQTSNPEQSTMRGRNRRNDHFNETFGACRGLILRLQLALFAVFAQDYMNLIGDWNQFRAGCFSPTVVGYGPASIHHRPPEDTFCAHPCRRCETEDLFCRGVCRLYQSVGSKNQYA